jgi:hypothetical protein
MQDDNNSSAGNDQAQTSQATSASQPTSTSTGRDFVQTDTSSSAYMQKGEDPQPLTKVTK